MQIIPKGPRETRCIGGEDTGPGNSGLHQLGQGQQPAATTDIGAKSTRVLHRYWQRKYLSYLPSKWQDTSTIVPDRTTNQVEIEIAESDTSAAQNKSAKNIDKIATLLRVREQGTTSARQEVSAYRQDTASKQRTVQGSQPSTL